MKRCTKCQELKPLSEFYKDTKARDGLAYRCKICTKKKVRDYNQDHRDEIAQRKAQRYQVNRETVRQQHAKYYQANREEVIKKSKIYATTPEGKEGKKKYVQKYRAANDTKVKAHRKVNHAIEKGKLPKASTQKCARCGDQAREYHHHKGYEPEHWLDIEPVCARCHRNL